MDRSQKKHWVKRKKMHNNVYNVKSIHIKFETEK